MPEILRPRARFAVLTLCTLLAVGACSTNKVSPATLALQAELESRELALLKEQQAIERERDTLEAHAIRVGSEEKKNKRLAKRLKALEQELQQREVSIKRGKAGRKVGKSAPATESGVLLLGATEKVKITPPDVQLIARMDTGAQRSILGVTYLAEFERDGEPHVRFNIVPAKGKKKIEVTRPIKDHVRATELNSSGKKRPVVLLRVALGSIDEQVEFVLIENSKAKVSTVSIGRNVLRDLAVVDVSKSMLIKASAD